ncbi:hypothetical protein [Pseudobacteroides cellulosolvens]|nr:hypothetical protein [Pseudobacteroides cellulosolvens]
MQETEKWNVDGVRSSTEWKRILELSDEIKKIIEQKNTHMESH